MLSRQSTLKRKNPYVKKKYKNFPVSKVSKYSNRDSIFRFSRCSAPATFNLGTSTDSLDAFTFDLADLPGYQEYTNLYQFYRIAAVAVNIKCHQTQTLVGSSNVPERNESAPNLPCIIAVDRISASAPANWGEVAQLEHCKLWYLLEGVRIYFKPTTLNGPDQMDNWVSTSSPTTPYYGLKMCIPPTGTDSEHPIHVSYVVKYYLEFKDPR